MDGVNELEQRHVGSTPGAIDREETEGRRRHLVEMGIAVRHQLHRLLRRRVDRHRLVGSVGFGERDLFIGAVDR
ncbi:hypothetical protein D3C72_2463160 [compost metagenome]